MSDAGLLHVETKPPKNPVDWEGEVVGDITVWIAPSVPSVESWQIEFERFPRGRLRGVSNLNSGSVLDGTLGGDLASGIW